MFLSSAEPGNPLYWFEQTFGSHLIGFPVIGALVFAVLLLPPYLLRRHKRTRAAA